MTGSVNDPRDVHSRTTDGDSETRKAPIALALDAPDLATMSTWVQEAAPFVSTMKIGMQTFYRDGDKSVALVSDSGCDLFLDLKLHDIPNTVAGAAHSLARFNPAYLTVHALGGAAMMEAAVNALPDTRITAVTVLTSLDDQELIKLGMETPVRTAVVRLAILAVSVGARAIVCSPQEVAAVRSAVPSEIVLITPGVRPEMSSAHDQKRVSTPEAALKAGADLLVIGRSITASADVASAARRISQELSWHGSRDEQCAR